MSQYRLLKNRETNAVILPRLKWCASTWCRFKGLMMVGHLPEDEGLLFVGRKDSKVDATIHMLFMRFSIGVVWVNAQHQVVDKKLAKPWRLAYAPKAAAKYFIEANPSLLERVEIGDYLQFDEPSS
jgi:uncharacterized membrane protein (UPF0127 family)